MESQAICPELPLTVRVTGRFVVTLRVPAVGFHLLVDHAQHSDPAASSNLSQGGVTCPYMSVRAEVFVLENDSDCDCYLQITPMSAV